MLVQITHTLTGLTLFLALIQMIQKKIPSMIRVFATQSAAIAGVAVVQGLDEIRVALLVVAASSLALKTFLIPYLLGRIIRRLGVRTDVEFVVRPLPGMFMALVIVAVSFQVAIRLQEQRLSAQYQVLPISIAILLLGLLLMITREKAITQVIGLLTMENGAFLAALSLVRELPLLVEFGVFFDLFVGVVIMGVFIYRISRSFTSIDVKELRSLRG